MSYYRQARNALGAAGRVVAPVLCALLSARIQLLAVCCAACVLLSGAGCSGVKTTNSNGGDDGGTPVVISGDLVNLTARVVADNVFISFQPVAGAKDYRVYKAPLLPDGTVNQAALPGADGGTAMRNGLYRCAGDREAPRIALDSEPNVQSEAMHAYVSHDVLGYVRASADATLGHVYLSAGPGRVPVYAMGDASGLGDNPCYFQRWEESRLKRYVTADSDRQALLAQGWRDHGVAFYAPVDGTAGTVQIYGAILTDGYGSRPPQLYFAAGAEQAARASPTPAFRALAAPADGTAPLMRVFYENACGKSHDELVAGQARFERAAHQGNVPLPHVQWSGLSGPTQLVVEALDTGCPFQGHLSPVSVPPAGAHQAFLSMADIAAADPNGEVFINGQHNSGRPRPIARSIVQLSPQPTNAPLDFHDGFDTDPGPFTEVPFGFFASKRFRSAKYDVSFEYIDTQPAMGVMLGEFWVTYGDVAADTNGKFRMTVNQKGTLAADSFLHVTMEVDMVTTLRRYPQILISNLDPPVQRNLEQGVTVIVQTIGVNEQSWPSRMDIQLCDHRTWDVNQQCPHFTIDYSDLSETSTSNPPAPVVGELGGVDRRVRWDVYASTRRVYALLDGQPVGCANLPAGVMPAGPTTVTFGDVLYHSGVDVPDPPFTFHHNYLHIETRRHFDELGFISGVTAPAWNETIVPCFATTKP